MAEVEIRIPEWAAGLRILSFTPTSLKVLYDQELPVIITLTTNPANTAVHVSATYKSGVDNEEVAFNAFVNFGGFTRHLLDAYTKKLSLALRACSPWRSPPSGRAESL